MKINSILYILILILKCIYAEEIQTKSNCNYIQIHGFLYDYQSILSDNMNKFCIIIHIFKGCSILLRYRQVFPLSFCWKF
jgi:hypothetical protein